MRVPREIAGGGEGFPPTWTNSVLRGPRRESNGKGPPVPTAFPGRLPPRPFTYKVAHGGRKRIPVTLSKRHGSPTERGPGKTPPRSRAPPARCPWLLLSARSLPGLRGRLSVQPGRCGAPGTRRGAGAGREGGAPGRRHLLRPAGLGSGRRCGTRWDRRAAAPAWSPRPGSGAPAPDPDGLLARGPRRHSLGMRDRSSDPAACWAHGCFSAAPLAPLCSGGNTGLRAHISG